MNFLKQLQLLVENDQYSDHPDHLAVVSKDESTLPGVIPKAVVWPTDENQVCQIVKLCYDHKVPITTRGAGSALEGSTIPLKDGIVMDLSRMTKIIELWADDLQVKVEPGIIYDNLNNILKNDGLFFPPSPGGSGDLATIGGMVSTNASGIYSVKYGGTKEYILSLDIVTGTGEKIKLGNRAVKRSSGYNLVELIVGSEGTLGIITSVILKLAGLPEGRLKTAFKFESEFNAAKAVSEIRKYGVDIAAIEFLDRNVISALNFLKQYNLEEVPVIFLEFHGQKEVLTSNCEMASSICEEFNGVEFTLDDNQNPWEIRHYVTDAIKYRKPGYTIIRNDVAFPISKLPEMVSFCHELGKKYDIMTHTFGHVGLGLLHALMLADIDNKDEWNRAQKMNDLIVEKTIELEGTVSGEHGIGLSHKELFLREHTNAVSLMKIIKKGFDPKNILNPGKIFDQ